MVSMTEIGFLLFMLATMIAAIALPYFGHRQESYWKQTDTDKE